MTPEDAETVRRLTEARERRRAQARQQGPRGVPAVVRVWARGLAAEFLAEQERPSPDIACDHCGGSHGTRTCPEVKAQHDGRGRR